MHEKNDASYLQHSAYPMRHAGEDVLSDSKNVFASNHSIAFANILKVNKSLFLIKTDD